MINSIRENYESILAGYQNTFELIKKKSTTISVIRLAEFIIGAILVYYATFLNLSIVFITITLIISIFLLLVKLYNELDKKKKFIQELININTNELMALKGTYDQFSSGTEFINPEHPYSYDLDIFGDGSVFQFLNRTSTIPGKHKLASWLESPFTVKDEIIDQQNAINELSSLLEWRQSFQATGNLYDDKTEDKEILETWFNSPLLFADKLNYEVLIVTVPAINIITFILAAFNLIPVQILFLFLLISLGIVGLYLKRTNEIHSIIGKRTELLRIYARLLKKIESSEFNSDKLKRLRNKLKKDETYACTAIEKIAKITAALDNRSNMIVGVLLNAFLLWDILQVYRIEKWKRRHKANLEIWFDVIAEFDALSSLASFRYNTPESIFPVVADDDFSIEAKEVGHPLIFRDQRVNNDIKVNHFRQFIIVTGANMAGKSTYLRTIGVNMVLAMCGSTIIAEEFIFTPIKLFTSLRTTDSLVKNESYFYAELRRLQRIINELKTGNELFIILDEILKGTNSKDKQTGSKALLKQLLEHDSAGFIATHDISLGELAEDYPNNILNRRFEVEIENNQLVFDYKLKEGVSQNLNATFLMKKMGITI